MSLRGKISDKLVKAWGKLDDVPVAGVFSVKTSTSYDPATGEPPIVDSDDYAVDVIFDTLTETQSEELTGGNGQFRALARYSQLPNVTPKIGDFLTVDSEKFTIIDVDVDPARVLWTGFLTKAGTVPDGIL